MIEQNENCVSCGDSISYEGLCDECTAKRDQEEQY